MAKRKKAVARKRTKVDKSNAGFFELFKATGSNSEFEWRWRLKARNGRILADSGEGYERRSHAVTMIERVIRMDKRTEIRDVPFVAPPVPAPPVPIQQGNPPGVTVGPPTLQGSGNQLTSPAAVPQR